MEPKKTLLEEAKRAFCAWRRERPHKRVPIPVELMDIALRACRSTRISTVARTLGLAHSKLKQHMEIKMDPPTSQPSFTKPSDLTVQRPSPAADFVDIALPLPSNEPGLVVEIERPDKQKVRFSFRNFNGRIDELVSLFL